MVLCAIAFIGVFTWSVLLETLLTAYFFEFLVMLFGAPFIYWVSSLSKKAIVRDEQERLTEG